MYNEILKIIEDVCGQEVLEDMSLFGDLEMDSVEMVEMVLQIEERYSFDFDSYDELMNHMDTVRDFAQYFEKQIQRIKGKD